jgi:hypothetical protein
VSATLTDPALLDAAYRRARFPASVRGDQAQQLQPHRITHRIGHFRRDLRLGGG